jgi:hypothetical protein
MIILINAGARVLTVPEMGELETQAGANGWYQVATFPLTEAQAEKLERDIARLIAMIKQEVVEE